MGRVVKLLLLLIKDVVLRQDGFWMNHLILIIPDIAASRARQSLLILKSLLWCQQLGRLVLPLLVVVI